MVVNIQFYCLPVSCLLAWQSMAICHYAWPFVCPSFCLPLCHLLAWLSVWLTGHINPVTNSDSCLCLFVIASVCLFMSVGLPVIFVEVCLVLKSIWMSCLLQSIPLAPSFLPSVSPPPPPPPHFNLQSIISLSCIVFQNHPSSQLLSTGPCHQHRWTFRGHPQTIPTAS